MKCFIIKTALLLVHYLWFLISLFHHLQQHPAEEEEDGNKERIHQWTDSTSTIDFCNQAVDYYEH